MTEIRRLPQWFKQPLPDANQVNRMKDNFRRTKLHTVCESAHCPNLGECWGRGTATFMILGDVCTRACRFCAIDAGRPGEVDDYEPVHVAQAIRDLNLRYVVITSVARDDLADEGAGQFVKTIFETKHLISPIKVEVLIPDFSARRELLKTIVDAKPEVISHNIETVSRLSQKVRPQADYQRSLEVLRLVKEMDALMITKSSIMVGVGETFEEVVESMKDLLAVGCDILTVGQYLSPSTSRRHLPVERFISPDEFADYKKIGLSLGFRYVASGPLVRSSYLAEEGYQGSLEGKYAKR